MCYILRCNQISQRLYRLTDLIIQQNQRSPIENGIKDLPERYIKRLRSKLQHPVAWFNIKALFVCRNQINRATMRIAHALWSSC